MTSTSFEARRYAVFPIFLLLPYLRCKYTSSSRLQTPSIYAFPLGLESNITQSSVYEIPKILTGKYGGKGLHGRSWRKWEDIIRKDHGKDVDWMQLNQDTDQSWALANTVMNFRVT